MPLNKGCSKKAFESNISKLMDEGKDRAQALAVAYDTLKSACRKQGKKQPK